MFPFILSKKAKKDIDHIYDYTALKWSIKQADNYFEIIQSEIRSIAKNPEKGRKYGNFLGSQVKLHIIFYRVNDAETIEIVRILHQKMDIKRRLSE